MNGYKKLEHRVIHFVMAFSVKSIISMSGFVFKFGHYILTLVNTMYGKNASNRLVSDNMRFILDYVVKILQQYLGHLAYLLCRIRCELILLLKLKFKYSVICTKIG